MGLQRLTLILGCLGLVAGASGCAPPARTSPATEETGVAARKAGRSPAAAASPTAAPPSRMSPTPRPAAIRPTPGVQDTAAPRSTAAPPTPRPTMAPMPSLDRVMEAYMAERGVPGGSLAVTRHGRLVYARGYGLADREGGVAAAADTRYRIASISKPITAVAIMRLVEQGKLKLDEPAFARLRLTPPEGKTADPRIATITVRQLLYHTGGWDVGAEGFDPMFRARMIADALGVAAPAGPNDVVKYMLGRPLDFAPGARHAYSNFGYCVLGRVIEAVTGEGYEAWVKREVLAPAGVTGMYVGDSRDRRPGESRYYMDPPETATSVFDGRTQVPWPDGGFHLAAMDAHGGWVASPVELVRFARALRAPSPLLSDASLATMYTAPPAPIYRKADGTLERTWYALGWSVYQQDPTRFNFDHNGSLPGNWCVLMRRHDGIDFAAMFNQRSGDGKPESGAIVQALHEAVAAIPTWPEADHFAEHP